jgi:4-hydroxybenzoate polyprenyltransferase
LNEVINKILKRIADALMFGNFFIAFCAAAMVSETYLQLKHGVVLDGLIFFVFFSTLALYNFHRFIGIKRIKEEDRGLITGWAADHQFTLLMLIIIGLGGAGFFVFQLYSKTGIFFSLIPLAAISVFYELPILKFGRRFLRIRNLWVSKVFLIMLVWAITTAWLPALNIRYPLSDYNVWLIAIERLIFIFILALCFDARDIEFDMKEDLQTIPIVYGMERTKSFYKILSVLFCAITFVHYIIINREWGTGAAMMLSGVITYFVVNKTQPRRSDYYYLFLVDGMMLLQFLLTWMLNLIM